MTAPATRPYAVRFRWMFRTAAAVFLFFGAVALWRFGFTDYHPEQRPYGLVLGGLGLLVGIFLLKLRPFAIGASAVGATVVGISAAVFAPNTYGPAILALALLALVCLAYAVMAVRAIGDRGDTGK